MSQPAPTARALGRSHPVTEQSKNLDVIVLVGSIVEVLAFD